MRASNVRGVRRQKDRGQNGLVILLRSHAFSDPAVSKYPARSGWVVKEAGLLSRNCGNQCILTCGAWAQIEPSYLLFP